MQLSEISITFIIVSLCFAGVLILSRNTLQGKFRRYLAIMAMVMVLFSFFLIVYALYSAS